MTISSSALTTESSSIMDPKASILCLPNEILSKIFENLPSKDRENVGILSDRLDDIEKRTGCRDFSTICFSTIDKPEIVARDVNANKFRKWPSEEGLANFFRRSTCRSLVIDGPLTVEHEQCIRSAFKSVDYKELLVDFKGDYSGRILIDLLRSRSDIEQLHIGGSRWMLEKEVEETRRVLMIIPTTRRLAVAASEGKILTDSILAHLVSVSHYTDLGGVKETDVTVEGLETAFEMVSAASHYKEVSCTVPASAVHQFLDRRQFSVVFRTNLQHIATGTKFNYRLDRDNQDYLYVSIQSDKSPVPL
ncbi:hypothetical protein PRIPAC_91061 [Pristionchus pacificus]|uniref:F-box domain-containing protein n=1 Tax=Pristionchus pacificus TaxID=54126 RepID=A0A2A6B8Q2_PRIPA|nr:hypothetical protein PRIPAC_91061 [Pristionchus pacificus]|eukprot:PDM62244.1 hypothetical protein PRIPAC_51686 [Pristionchus pacificus]